MHPVVEKLLALQQVDSRVAAVQRKLDAIPQETRKREARLAALTAERDGVKKRIREIEIRIADLESRVLGIDAAIKKQENYRDQARNASTFEAARLQILTEDRERLQTEEMALIEEQEGLQPKLEELERKVSEMDAEFRAYLDEAARLERELREERDRISEERKQFLTEIPPAQMNAYEDLFHSRGGVAVVAVEDDHCSGCYTRITPNDAARLAGGSAVVTCKSCGRFLYLP